MNAEQVKAAVDAAIGSKIILSYAQLILFVLLSGAAAYLGAYLKKKGENWATHEDVERLNRAVEDIKATYSKQLEDYKADLTRRSRAAEVAEFFTYWSSPKADHVKLNGYAMMLSLWLPDELYRDIGRCVCYAAGAKTPKQILVDVRKYLLKADAGNLTANDIIHFTPPAEGDK